jgi:hypothetical protein
LLVFQDLDVLPSMYGHWLTNIGGVWCESHLYSKRIALSIARSIETKEHRPAKTCFSVVGLNVCRNHSFSLTQFAWVGSNDLEFDCDGKFFDVFCTGINSTAKVCGIHVSVRAQEPSNGARAFNLKFGNNDGIIVLFGPVRILKCLNGCVVANKNAGPCGLSALDV